LTIWQSQNKFTFQIGMPNYSCNIALAAQDLVIWFHHRRLDQLNYLLMQWQKNYILLLSKENLSWLLLLHISCQCVLDVHCFEWILELHILHKRLLGSIKLNQMISCIGTSYLIIGYHPLKMTKECFLKLSSY
jgi:hypothetical protein